jgi:putative DNA primase/helicase
MNQTPKPRALTTLFDAIPPELKALPQWVGWRFVWREGKPGEAGKWTKAPFRADGKGGAKSTDPETWATFDQAKTSVKRLGFDGIGFVFSPEDQYFGVDLDACRDKETGQLTPEASDWVNRFGTYCEVSPSGTGVKLIGLGALPEGTMGRRNATTGAECYDRGRYFTVTGQRLQESPESCEGAPDVLTAFLAHHFPKKEAAPVNQSAPLTPLDMDDYELLAKANGAKDGAKFAALWSGSHAGLPGASEADMALAGLLLFWTQGDQARTEAMMRRSGLAREKWDTMRGAQTYLEYTIAKAAEGKTEFYNPLKTGSSVNFVKNATFPLRGDRNKEEEEEEEIPPSISANLTKLTKLTEWDSDPLSFGQEDLPPFPTWALPPVLRDFSEGLAASVGTAPDLPGVQVLAAVAAATQKRVAVAAKRGYIEPLTLWCIGIAPPGSRKSAIMGHIRKPFTVHEAKENERRLPEVDRFESEERLAKLRLTRAEGAAAKGNPSIDDRAELDTARRSLSELKPVRPLRLLADDATPEVLAMMLSENEGKLAVLDAEGAAFGHMIGRYSQNPAIEIYLKAHAGEDHTTDRAGGSGSARRTVSVHQAALTIGCAVQPEVLADLRKKKELAGRGALARCLFSFSEDTDAADEFDTPDLDEQALASYRRLISDLLTLSASRDLDDDGQPIPHMIGLDDEARVLFTDFYREVQKERRAEGDGLFAEWLAKLHGATLRIAGVLHMAEHGKPGAELSISSETMQGAIDLARYFSAHAQAALARIREDEATEGALRILGWVKRNAGQVAELTDKQGGVSLRDLRRQLRSFESEPDLAAALCMLASRGYAREAPMPEREEGTRGRKPTAKWQFHPSLVWSVEV